jgi:hypothetical protein
MARTDSIIFWHNSLTKYYEPGVQWSSTMTQALSRAKEYQPLLELPILFSIGADDANTPDAINICLSMTPFRIVY